MEKNVLPEWNGVERRKNRVERREFFERRLSAERRFDFRKAHPQIRRSLKSWFRSLANARLGVDRRSGVDRRALEDRRSKELRSILTPEEIADLLGE